MFRPTFFSRPWVRRGLFLVAAAGVALLWKGTLLLGPNLFFRGEAAPPALFRFHAKGLILAELEYPRDLEATLPAPPAGSNQAAQLQLMGWWDGKVWTEKALAKGRGAGRDLRVRLGHLSIAEVQEVTPARGYNGVTLCQVDYRVRWDLPDSEAELFRLQPLVGLRLPVGLPLRMPGQLLVQQVTLERVSWGWKVQDSTKVRGHAAGLGRSRWTWIRWIL
jgi:hypothetical protein